MNNKYTVLFIASLLFVSTASASIKSIEEEFFDEIYAMQSLIKAHLLLEFMSRMESGKVVILRDRYQRKGGSNYKVITPANLYIRASNDPSNPYADIWLSAADSILTNPAKDLTEKKSERISLAVITPAVSKIKQGKLKAEKTQKSEKNIRTIQGYLDLLGYEIGIVDGIPGKKTTAALSKFRADIGLPVNNNYTAVDLFPSLEDAVRSKLESVKQELRQRGLTMRRLVQDHVALIQKKVQRNWKQPLNSHAGLSCTVEVRLIPNGDVIDAIVIRGSGNSAFDGSVQVAVFKASPLPVPKDQKAMEQFRSLRFEFTPR